MTSKNIGFNEFIQLGSESHYRYSNKLIQWFIRKFGPLGINIKIRSSHIFNQFVGINLPSNSKILDAGCGLAYIDFWIKQKYPESQIIAIDIDKDIINKNQLISEKLGNKFLIFKDLGIEQIDYLNEFDLIYSMDVLEHLNDDIGALQNIYKALKPSGILLLHLPLRYSLNKRILPGYKRFFTPDHVRPEYDADEICQKLNQTGFEVSELSYTYNFWGELAFELNYLFWWWPNIRMIFSVLTHPIVLVLAYWETRKTYRKGNALLIKAIKKLDM